jgi:A/G-specific adenine glycosylase
MAQQTQIVTLIPYFERWMVAFPCLEDVARATEDEVLKLWEGLGYYSRARNLKKTCEILMHDYNGTIPSDEKSLLALPGVGPYIAAAVASIAFGQPTPVVDGNVCRVITRLFGISDDILKQGTKNAIRARLDSVIRPVDPSAFNQGLMELGATVCMPTSPTCTECPLKDMCYAKQYNKIADFPVKKKKAPIPHYHVVVGLIKDKQGHYLLTKRKTGGFLGGLWEFPGGKVEDGETNEEALHRELQEELNVKVTIDSFLGTVKHAYSHFKVTIDAFECRPKRNSLSNLSLNVAEDSQWLLSNAFDSVAVPSGTKKVMGFVL